MGAALRSNAIENGRVLLELAKTRHAFERRAVALGYSSGALHVTAVRNPGIVCVAVEQVGLSCASDAQSADQDGEEPPTRHRHRLRPLERSKAYFARNRTPRLVCRVHRQLSIAQLVTDRC